MYRRILSFIIAITICSSITMAQTKGYKIKLTIPSVSDSQLYLKGFYGSEEILFDSAKVRNGEVVFKGSTALPEGFYQVINKADTIYTELIIDKEQKFFIDLSASDKITTNSPTNRSYFELWRNINSIPDINHRTTFIEQFAHIAPESLLAKYCQLYTYSLHPERILTIDNYFDNADLHDPRMLRHPFFHQLVSAYFTVNDSDNNTKYEERIFPFFKQCNSEIRQYYLQWLIKQFNTDGSVFDDFVLIYIYDNFCKEGYCDFLSETNARILKNTITRKRRVLPGQKVPFLSAYNTQNKLESTENINKEYTIIWFWDPDCDDCQIETPRLHQFYFDHASDYNFEVFAISITEDIEKWKQNVDTMQLSWINVCNGMGEPNYDFVDYFNLLTTPSSFLLDKEHKIIMRNFSLEQLESFFTNSVE